MLDNRALISRRSSMHFAPTSKSKQNLVQENISEERIWVAGNTVIDSLFWMNNQINLGLPLAKTFGSAEQVIASNKPLILVTGHRRENFGEGFRAICRAIAKVANGHPDWEIVYPVHLNPNVQNPVSEILGNQSNIHLIDPQDYPQFVYLLGRAKLVFTDSTIAR